MSEINVETSRWPLVVVTYPAEFSDIEWETHGQALSSLLSRGQRFALLSDASNAPPPSVSQRQYASKKLASEREEWNKYCAGSAFVSSSRIIRGVMMAINWVSPPPFPQQVFASVAEGEVWLRTLIDFPLSAA